MCGIAGKLFFDSGRAIGDDQSSGPSETRKTTPVRPTPDRADDSDSVGAHDEVREHAVAFSRNA